MAFSRWWRRPSARWRQALVDEAFGLGKLLALGAVLTSFAVAVGGYTVLVSAASRVDGQQHFLFFPEVLARIFFPET